MLGHPVLVRAARPAHADLTIGVVQPLTGPASGLGIPVKNGILIWPKTIGGETVKLLVLDDASDPTTGVKDTQRLVTDDKVDVIVGSSATPVAIPMADVTAEAQTPQLSTSPAGLPPGKDKWFFRLPQSNGVMAYAMAAHMKKQGIKTIGFLGYTDAYGELWLKAITEEAAKNGFKIVGTERFARADTSVTAQALKLTSANPDAILIVASGSGAGMPQKAIMERGYKGKIYQTHSGSHPRPDAHRRQGCRRHLRRLGPRHARRATAPTATRRRRSAGPGLCRGL